MNITVSFMFLELFKFLNKFIYLSLFDSFFPCNISSASKTTKLIFFIFLIISTKLIKNLSNSCRLLVNIQFIKFFFKSIVYGFIVLCEIPIGNEDIFDIADSKWFIVT